ncbi:MAG: ligase-associated DNA damage response endonuclease PdeM [Planctomycetota bacterium]
MTNSSAEPGATDASIECGGGRFTLTPEHAAFCESTRSLLVADTHLGKSEAFRASGVPVPAGDADEQLERLSGVIARTGAERVVVIGDLLHAPAGLSEGLIERVRAWRTREPIELNIVPGNHDRRLDRVVDAWRLRVRDEGWGEGPFTCWHDPADVPRHPFAFAWSGHVHPVVVLRSGPDRLRLPAYIVGEDRAVLPAFSRFTGGVSPPASLGSARYAIAGRSVVRVPD